MANHDIERSEGEGMIYHEEYVSEPVSKETALYVGQVLYLFRGEKNLESVEKAEERLKAEFLSDKKKVPEIGRIRDVLKILLDDKALKELEEEETRRTLEHDAYIGRAAG